MAPHEFLAGRPDRDPSPGSSTPLATTAALGAVPVRQEFALTGLKPLRG